MLDGQNILRTSSDVFIFNLGLRFGGLIWDMSSFEEPNRVWRALKTSIWNNGNMSKIRTNSSGSKCVLKQEITVTESLVGEKRQWSVIDEPVEFQDCRKITDHFRGIYRIHPNSVKENRRLSTCNRLDLQTLGSRPVMMPKNLPDRWNRMLMSVCKPWRFSNVWWNLRFASTGIRTS